MNWEYIIGFILAALLLAGIIIYFPQIKEMATGSSLLKYNDLSATQQTKIVNTFNEFAQNIQNCLGNGKTNCICNNSIPNYPFTFSNDIKKGVSIKIIPSKDLSKFVLNLTFSGQPVASKEFSGQMYIVDSSGKEISFRPEIILGIRAGPAASLKGEQNELLFQATPVFHALAKDYNQNVAVQAGLYKSSSIGVNFIDGNLKASAC